MKRFLSLLIIIPVLFTAFVGCTEKGEPYDPVNPHRFIKYYGRSKQDFGNDLIRTKDGGYLIAGGLTDHYTEEYPGDLQFYLLKVDKFGNEEWSLSLGDSLWDDVANSVIESADGSFLAVGKRGYTNIGVAGLEDSTIQYSNTFLTKIGSDGTVIWKKDSIKNTNSVTGKWNDDDEGKALVELPDGSIFVLSKSQSKNEGSKPIVLASKFTADGDFIDDWDFPNSLVGYEPVGCIYKVMEGEPWIVGLMSFNKSSANNIALVKIKPSDITVGAPIDLPSTGNDIPGRLLDAYYGENFYMIGTKQVSGVSQGWFGVLDNSDFNNPDPETLPKVEALINETDANVYGRAVCWALDYEGFVVLSDREMSNDQYDLQLTYVNADGTQGLAGSEEAFTQTFGYTGQEQGVDIVETGAGYAILANSMYGGDQKIMLIKTDENGVVR